MERIFKKIRFNSPVVLGFTIMCFLAFGINYITGGRANSVLFSCIKAKYIGGGMLNPLFYIRLLTHIIGHADWAHITGNMTYILLLGPLLEEKYGSLNILFIILCTALVTGIINVLFFSNGLLGASGVVFAFIILSSLTDFNDGRIPLTFIIVTVVYIGSQLFDAVFVRDNVSNLSHIIGGLIGGICGIIINKDRNHTKQLN